MAAEIPAIFTDADKAREHLEAQRWPNGVVCAQCGNADPSKIHGLKGKAHRPGVYQCAECREQFTVTVGTVFERSKIPLNKWMLAVHLMTSSKKGISAHQIHRMLGVTYKTAWFMWHRIREAMKAGGLSNVPPMGGKGKVVEADETYFHDLPEHKQPLRSNPEANRPKHGPTFKRAIVSLVERGGEARSFYVGRANVDNVAKIVRENVAKESRLHTDESRLYHNVGRDFAAHEAVNHGQKEYARGDVSTNAIESFFSVFKRGMRGTYQHCDERHLPRYLAEFDFRFNNRSALGVGDNARTVTALKGVSGKRLTYQQAR